MRFDDLLPIESWKAIATTIGAYSDASCWWLGDWLAFGQMKYGRRYKEGIALTGLEYQTLRNYAVVARRYELSRRRDNLSFHHHAELCALRDDDQDAWLDLAAQHGWSKAQLRQRLRRTLRPRPTAHDVVLRLPLTRQRAKRWRAAARDEGLALEDWIAEILDEAADRARSA
jgi:hypothetical protein